MSIPDQHIHPSATGEAAKVVAAHQAPEEVVFYSGWFCPYVQRTWIALEEKGIPYQYKEVNPYKKEKHFLDINPKGLVPALEYRGKALYESLILCEFLEDLYPNNPPYLLPHDPYDRAFVRIWVDHISKRVIPAFMRLLQSQEREKQDEARKDLYEGLRQLSEKCKGPYFLGAELSLVDVAIAPWVVREYVITENRGYKRSEVSDAWNEWAGLLEKRESVVRTTSERAYYAEIYGRYLRDEAQSEAAKATRAGRIIP
ncbi:glutathione-S-transferase [Fomitiporia mediterranea MF3/22]|uniref:glutathione-S-transferase n=1 Tax=Fomitiporia mediterranea (strain MF3/22) TaxID=694068 RepID=UPI00044097DF|nr:glutathione-S-transferase [Fomitiporia mediterranea MF3/22]EJC98963.1 glutathione-S-transferase [Fomitiporia mediterranea MF3/22]